MAGLGRRSHYRKHLTDAVLHDLPEPDASIGQRIARVVGTRGGNMFDVIVAPPSSSTNTELAAGTEAVDDVCQPENGSFNEQTPQPADETASDLLPPIHNIDVQRTQQLAFLPTKFRKLVWIKRNDFVIVDCGDEEEVEEEKDEETTRRREQQKADEKGFRFVITHILYKDQVKHIKSKGLWPLDPYFADEGDPMSSGDGGSKKESNRTMAAATSNNEDRGEKKAEKDKSHPDNNDDDEGVDDDEPQYYGESAYEDNGIVFDDHPLEDEFMVNTNRIATLRVEDSSSDEDSD
ncbi:hypothetical protein ACHAXR_006858 [Thalassiosira sp. AJA248-18]